MTVRYTAAAVRDLTNIEAYIAQDDPERARALVRTVRACIDHLARFPRMGRPGKRPGTRELILADVPYLAIYRLRADRVEVLRIRHQRQQR
jgi:toxin ParE1/3/4